MEYRIYTSIDGKYESQGFHGLAYNVADGTISFFKDTSTECWAKLEGDDVELFKNGDCVYPKHPVNGFTKYGLKVQLMDVDTIAPKDETRVQKDDLVNNPKHYNSHPSGVECIEIKRHMTPNVGDVFKYLWRAGLKDSAGMDSIDKAIQDHEKALWYLNDEIRMLKNIRDNGGEYNPNCKKYGKIK